MMKKTLCLLAALLLLCSCAGTAEGTEPVTEINPMAEAAATDTVSVMLYFRNESEDTLIGELRDIEAPLHERVEQAILRELIEGPSSSKGEFGALIDPDTKVVSVSDDSDFLIVTLSEDFILPLVDFGSRNEDRDTRMRLAIYSIVNTLVEYSGYSRIQLLIDDSEGAAARRLTLAEAGFEGQGSLEAIGRNGDIVMTPENTARAILTAIERKDFNRLYSFIAYNDLYGTVRPTEAEFTAEVQAEGIMLERQAITGASTSHSGDRTVVFADFSVRHGTGATENRTNIPIMLVLENDVWKLRYSTLKALLYAD